MNNEVTRKKNIKSNPIPSHPTSHPHLHPIPPPIPFRPVSHPVSLVIPYLLSSHSIPFIHHRLSFRAAQITAIGELVTLPLVVLVSFMAQPRLLFAMAKDGLLPRIFSEVTFVTREEHGWGEGEGFHVAWCGVFAVPVCVSCYWYVLLRCCVYFVVVGLGREAFVFFPCFACVHLFSQGCVCGCFTCFVIGLVQ